MNIQNYKRNNQNLTRNNDSNQYSIKPINTFSLKPISLIIPQDIDVKVILKNMMEKTKTKNDKYYIYKKLSQSEQIKRKTIIESMKKFLIENRIKCFILYSSIFIFDILISKNQNNDFSYDEIGIGALILSVKFNNEYNNIIYQNKKTLYFNYNEYSFSEIAEIEISCLQILEYKLDFYHPIHFMEFLLLNGIIFNTDKINTEESYKVYSSALNILEYIMILNNKYLKFHPFFISCSIVSLCRENSNLEIWPYILSHVFNIQFSMFKDVFNFVSVSYKSKNRNNYNINNNNKLLSPSLIPVSRKNSNLNVTDNNIYVNNINFNSPNKYNENMKEEEKYKTPIKLINSQKNFVINLSVKQNNKNSPSKILKVFSHLHRASSTDKKLEKSTNINYSNSSKKQLLYYCNNYSKFEKEVNSNEPTMENSKRENLIYLNNEKVKEPNNIGLFKMNNFRQGSKFISVNKSNLNDSDYQNNNNLFDLRINNLTRNYVNNQSISSERIKGDKNSYNEKVKIIPDGNYFFSQESFDKNNNNKRNILNNYLNFNGANLQNQNLNKKLRNVNSIVNHLNSSGIKNNKN